MPQSPTRRPSRPRTLEWVERRTVGGAIEFVFAEGERPVIARRTARAFTWDADAPETVPEVPVPRREPERGREPESGPQHPPVPAGLAEAGCDAQLAELLGLLGRVYHRRRR